MQVSTEHLALDEKGVVRIDGTGIKVKHLAMLNQHGQTAEQIHQDLPHLSLAQIHAALAYYHDHRSEIDAVLRKDEELSQSMRDSREQTAFVARLRERAAKLP